MRRATALVLAVGALTLALGWGGTSSLGGPEGVEATTSSTTIRWGPYTVPKAMGGTPGSTDNQLDLNVQVPCSDCYITKVVPNLVYATGASYPEGTTVNFSTGGMLHHMVLVNVTGSDATCDVTTLIGSLGERILASGNERTAIEVPFGYGYYVDPGDVWTLIIDIMSFQTEPQPMYLEFEFEYRAGSEAVDPVKPIWLDVDNCEDSEYPVPAGYADTHWDWTSNLEGNIVAIAGHVHNYGISIAAELVEAEEYMCTSIAGYAPGSAFAPAPVAPGDEGHPGASSGANPSDPGYEGRIEDMTGCYLPKHVFSGDTIRLHTQYNSPAPQDDVMGIMVAYMHETTDLPDYDGDGVPDPSDNCPAWPNPGQGMPSWPVPAGDPDCDGFESIAETAVGTYEMVSCAATDDAGDEEPDSWPPDFDDNQVVNILDIVQLTPPVFNSVPGDPDYSARKDIKPDGIVNILDIVLLTPPFFSSDCAAP